MESRKSITKFYFDYLKRQKTELKRKKQVENMQKTALKPTVTTRSSTVQNDIESFCLYGNLKKAETEVHNSLPSEEVIRREKELLQFEEVRKGSPHAVLYKDFYRYLSPAVSPNYQTIPGSAGKERKPLESYESR